VGVDDGLVVAATFDPPSEPDELSPEERSPEELSPEELSPEELSPEELSPPLPAPSPLPSVLPCPSAEPDVLEPDDEVARRSFLAQPEPLKWMAGAANALRSWALPQFGQALGPSACTPCITSKRWPHEAQS
jgi:hypothetical protein